MNVDEKVIDLIVNDTASRPDALVLGARGLSQALSIYFTEPLTDFIFGNEFKNCIIVAKVNDSGSIRFSLSGI